MNEEIIMPPETQSFDLTQHQQILLRHLIASSISEHQLALNRAETQVTQAQINYDLAGLYSLRKELQKHDGVCLPMMMRDQDDDDEDKFGPSYQW